jgi:hypothetical protein
MDSTRRGIAGIDVHKKMLAVVVRRETDGKLEYEKRKFGTTHKEILAWRLGSSMSRSATW